MTDKKFKVKDLMVKTEAQRDLQSVIPDENDPDIPESVFKYKPVIWMEDNIYHTLLGKLPDEGIWVPGTTSLESMLEFDKELQIRLNDKGEIEPIPKEKRQQIHKEVFEKIDEIMGWKA